MTIHIPEALRLADALMVDNYGAAETQVERRAAAELRRLHAENERLKLAVEKFLKAGVE